MAWSIESRVPFLDYRLVEFLAGLPDEMKLRLGVTKVVLRRAMDGVLPEAVRDRRDKMGFVTPEQTWLNELPAGWVREQIHAAIDTAPDMLNADMVMKEVDDIMMARRPFSFLPWRFICLGRWLRTNSEFSGRQLGESSPEFLHMGAVQSIPE